MVMRGQKRKGTRYFGPYGHAYAIRETLDLLLRTFPVRTCSDNKFERHHRQGRPCLLYHIEKCSGPCVGNIEREPYDALVAELIAFLDGETQPVLRRLQAQMHDAADGLEFERAARLRDRLASVQKAIEKQAMVTDRPDDLDVVGIADDELEASVQVFYVRRGRVVGRKGFVVDKVEDVTAAQLVSHVLEGLYHEPALGVPKEVLAPVEPDDLELYERWLAGQRGSRVTIRVPHRGDKRELQATVTQNAKEEFVRHRLKRSTDHNARARALNALQAALDLPEAPLRIECYDMSHIQGTDYVGSMVVMEDALPKKSDYRRFKVRSVPGNDDVAAMEEVLARRLAQWETQQDLSPHDPKRNESFAMLPNVVVIDGGPGQLGAGLRALQAFRERGVAVISLAKRIEEVFVPGGPEPIVLAHDTPELQLLQRVRDEAHRFAITHHRTRRDRAMTSSILDELPGVGPSRKRALLAHFGSPEAILAASREELEATPGLPGKTARELYMYLHRTSG
jgi:excinuclease ABC subunit C